MDGNTGQLVLNVDGDEASRRTNSRALRAAGIEVEEAGSASEALAAVQHQPRVVVFGGALRDGDGHPGVRGLRDAVSVPVVQVGATGDASLRHANAYLGAGPAPEELVATVRAMLRLEGAERAVRENEKNYRALIDSLVDGAFIAENDRLIFVNRPLAQMLGGTPDSLVGLPFRALVVQAIEDGEGLQRLAAGGESAPARCEVQLRGLDRQMPPVWTEVRVIHLRRDGGHTIVGVVR